MADWQDIKKNARRITAKLRAVQPANAQGLAPMGELADRLPRPTPVDLVAQPRAKMGHEISGAQMADLKSGRIKIDAQLDLHGMTQRVAFDELTRFMQKQIHQGARLLLIITGKGKDFQGVLRQQLPGWLMAGAFKPHILTIHPAHARHGGDGATYVLLRKPPSLRA